MQEPRMKTTWAQRLVIRLGAAALGVLVFWLLGFLVSDIRGWKGPQWEDFEPAGAVSAMANERVELQRKVDDLRRRGSAEQEALHRTADVSNNLRDTVRQLTEAQKQAAEGRSNLSASEQASLTDVLRRFLANQEQYQSRSSELIRMEEERRQAEERIVALDRALEELRAPARLAHAEALNRHRLRLAAAQLGLLLPLLAIAGWMVARRRESPYFVVALAVGLAILAKVVGVVHEYFPRRVFNYLLIVALILVVLRILVVFIRQALHPKPAVLLRKYREAYERFLCPVCDHPIRSGPRRYLYWTRRTVNKVLPPSGGDLKPESYTCPACGTGLYAACSACGGIRHCLLPHCEHCGATAKTPAE